MTTIKSTTKKGSAYIEKYNASRDTMLRDIYGSWSTAKEAADRECRALMLQEDGNGYRIISHNCNFFTVAWQTAKGLRIETAYDSIIVTE